MMSNILDALKAARQFIVNGTALGFIRMPDADTPDSANDTLPMIERAIAELEAQSMNTLEPRTYADEPLSHIKAIGELVQDARGINISGDARKVSAFLLCGAAVPELVAHIEELVGNVQPPAVSVSDSVLVSRELLELAYLELVDTFSWAGELRALLDAESAPCAKSQVEPAPVAVVPEGYCIMPRQLTAENGAKALLLGEFKLLVTKECTECCDLEEPTEGCSICDGEGEYGQKHIIPWDQIKFIYSKAVSGLSIKPPEPATIQEPGGA
jgi:hypothetical protein